MPLFRCLSLCPWLAALSRVRALDNRHRVHVVHYIYRVRRRRARPRRVQWRSGVGTFLECSGQVKMRTEQGPVACVPKWRLEEGWAWGTKGRGEVQIPPGEVGL